MFMPVPQLTMVDVRDQNGYSKGKREGKKRVEDNSEMEDGVGDEKKWCWKNLHWGHCPRWIQCLTPVAVLWVVIQEEILFLEVEGWLLMAGMLWTGLILCVSFLKLLNQYRRQYKQKVSENSETAGKRTEQPHQACLYSQQDASHLLSMMKTLLDCLVVSLLQESVSDPRISQIQGLLTKLAAVSQLITVAVNNSFLFEERLLLANNKDDKMTNTRVEDRLKHICTYLQERVSSLHFLLQIQDQYGVCIANIQEELQEYWELLEDLHTKVTLQPKKCQHPEDPYTVLTDTQGLYTKLGLFQSRIHECQAHLSKSVHLLKELENRHQELAQTMGLMLESTWTKDLLQGNTHQFKKVFKDFTSLTQQTLTFVMHLQELSVSQEKYSIKTSDVEHAHSSLSPPSSLPVYSIALATENSSLDPDPRPTNTPSSRFSVINLLCGVRRRR